MGAYKTSSFYNNIKLKRKNLIKMSRRSDIEKEIITATNKISKSMLEYRIPSGVDLRVYFKCYDEYRLHKISHMIPKGAKNLKDRLINFLINHLKLPARISVDPVPKEFRNGTLDFSQLIVIALDERWMVAFHVKADKHKGLQKISRQLLPTPVNKRAIADFFDAQIAQGNTTINLFRKNQKFVDHFARYLERHNHVNENVQKGG